MNTTYARTLKMAVVVTLALLLVMVFSVATSLRNESATSQSLAHDAGLDFVSSVASSWHSNWTNISLANPVVLYGLNDEEVGYQFAVQSNASIVGTIVVGNQDFSYQPLELVSRVPLQSPTATELSEAVERDFQPSRSDPVSSDKTLYLGYQKQYELYEVDSQEVAFHLEDRTLVLKSELEDSLSRPAGSTASYGTTLRASGDGYWSVWEVISGVPIYGQSSDDVDDEYKPNNCGPTTGAMIVDYYRVEESYSDFDSWVTNHDTLYDTMNTDDWCPHDACEGTLPTGFKSGWLEYADDKGYDFLGRTSNGWPGDKWGDIKDSIDDDEPLAVMYRACDDAPEWHWNAVKGYGTWVDGGGDETDYMVVNDPGGSDGFDGIVSWSANYRCLNLAFLEPE